MIEQVFISGQIGKAIYEEDNRHFIVGVEDYENPIECRYGDISMFFDCGAEFTIISSKDIGLSDIRNSLESSRLAYRALFLAISGFDGELSNEIRSLSIEAVEELFQNKSSYAFVRARLLGRPLPEMADINGAIFLAESGDTPIIKLLYKEVQASQKAVQDLLEVWKKIALKFFDSYEEQARGERALIEMGVFAEIVTVMTSGDIKALDSIAMNYGLQPEFKKKLPKGVFIIRDIKTQLLNSSGSSSVTTGGNEEKEEEPVEVDPIRRLITGFVKKKWKGERKQLTTIEIKDRVDRQIDAIKKLIHRDKMHQARRYLYDLIRFNLNHGKKEHVGMTLCSLAKVAMDVHKLEMADKLVEYAFLLGIEDIVIRSTGAQLLKEKGQLAEALSAYDEMIK
ncbi:TPA: hypothetical protein DCX15_03865, partial [bacterium]|nr:hypothetical protein [bacterium]